MPDGQNPKALVWFRRDLRLSDNPALEKAAATGLPVICLFIKDREVDALGAAAKWRLGCSLQQLDADLRARGTRLIFRSGDPLQVLSSFIANEAVRSIHYCRCYTPEAVARDTAIKSSLSEQAEIVSHCGSLLFEPWTVNTGAGGYYKVYSPFWRAVRDRAVEQPRQFQDFQIGSDPEIDCEDLEHWQLGSAMNRGAEIVLKSATIGEAKARARLDRFIDGALDRYADGRNFLDRELTSGLSENLAFGEISPRQMWSAGMAAWEGGSPGAETFLKEIAWREFAYHLAFRSPQILEQNWKSDWDGFPWRGDNEDAEAWRRGQTGEPVVDAAMREIYATGTMHNRARMIVASYLTKHLMVHWKVGMDWFADCLIDWDPASNAMGWQWTAGSGPDAAPFFRVFNPATQAEKFDPSGTYRNRYLDPAAEGAKAFFAAAPRAWGLDPGKRPETPIISLKEGRERALAAYKAFQTGQDQKNQSKQEETA